MYTQKMWLWEILLISANGNHLHCCSYELYNYLYSICLHSVETREIRKAKNK
jgi:hypothetical protein